MRVKRSVQTFTGKYQVLAVAFGDAGDQVCFGNDSCAMICTRMLGQAKPSTITTMCHSSGQ